MSWEKKASRMPRSRSAPEGPLFSRASAMAVKPVRSAKRTAPCCSRRAPARGREVSSWRARTKEPGRNAASACSLEGKLMPGHHRREGKDPGADVASFVADG